MKNVKLMMIVLLCVAMLAVGFILGAMWAGNMAKNLQRVAGGNFPQKQQTVTEKVDRSVEKELLERVKVNPEDVEALALLGDFYFDARQYKEAVEYYKKTLQLNPTDGDTYNDLGLAQFYLGKNDEALETLEDGVSATPDYQRIYLTYGFVLSSLKKNEEAKKVWEKAVEIDPDSTVGKEAKKFLEKIQ
ncbi:MAG: tetratricopeptide repeat protein [bacterium]